MKLNLVTTKLELKAAIEAIVEYLSAVVVMVIMDTYEAVALKRFLASVFYNELSSKADTLIDTTALLKHNFVSKEFLMANVFYKDCKFAPKRSIRVASKQRNSTTTVLGVFGLYH